jgi:hypothetical protein
LVCCSLYGLGEHASEEAFADDFYDQYKHRYSTYFAFDDILWMHSHKRWFYIRNGSCGILNKWYDNKSCDNHSDVCNGASIMDYSSDA